MWTKWWVIQTRQWKACLSVNGELIDLNNETSHTGRERNKICTYRHFKHSSSTSHYLKETHLTHAQSSAMAKMRCGVAPICLKTGWYEGLTEQKRICPVCDVDEIESEIHVMMFCPLYNDIRATLYHAALPIDNDFNSYKNMHKFVFLIYNKGITRKSAKACHSIKEEDMFI